MNSWMQKNGSVLTLWATGLAIPFGFTTSLLGFFADTSALTSVIGIVVAVLGVVGFAGSWAAHRAAQAREALIDSQLDWSIQMTLWNSEMIAARSPHF